MNSFPSTPKEKVSPEQDELDKRRNDFVLDGEWFNNNVPLTQGPVVVSFLFSTHFLHRFYLHFVLDL